MEEGTGQTSGTFFPCDTGPGKSWRVGRMSYLFCLKECNLTYLKWSTHQWHKGKKKTVRNFILISVLVPFLCQGYLKTNKQQNQQQNALSSDTGIELLLCPGLKSKKTDLV